MEFPSVKVLQVVLLGTRCIIVIPTAVSASSTTVVPVNAIRRAYLPTSPKPTVVTDLSLSHEASFGWLGITGLTIQSPS
jgi:hypothetical protein